jgi:DNA-binding CsgD family transcriptional regulator
MLDGPRLERLTDWAVAAHQARDFESLACTIAEAVSDLVECDWPLISLAPSMPEGGRLWHSTKDAEWEQFGAAALQHAPQDPVYTGRLRLQHTEAASVGRFTDHAAFSMTDLYNEVWRPLGVKWTLADYNPGRYAYRLAAVRSRGSDFTSVDAMILHALARHMDGATARLVRDHGGLLPTKKGKIPIQTCSWLVCDRTGAILRTGGESMDHYRACLGAAAAADRVPQTWVREYTERLGGRAGKPQNFCRNGRRITAYIAPIKGSPGEFSVFFVESALRADPAQTLRGLGLTGREAEVLRWVAEGKTNPEIGIILGISELTAKKHMENVLHKLGVPTRTAAAARAIEHLASCR